MAASPQFITVKATKAPTACIIFIHGLGQSNATWGLLVKEAFAPRLPHVTFVLPQGPNRHVSMNKQKRPSWFDIRRLPPKDEEYDEEAIHVSCDTVEHLILQQIHSGIDAKRIVLMGFSQGAALGAMVALNTLNDLGGYVSLSGWIPPKARPAMADSAPHQFPILWCHGTTDDEIPLSYGESAVSFLRDQMRISVTFKKYEGLGHTICDAEVEDVVKWLETVLS